MKNAPNHVFVPPLVNFGSLFSCCLYVFVKMASFEGKRTSLRKMFLYMEPDVKARCLEFYLF